MKKKNKTVIYPKIWQIAVVSVISFLIFLVAFYIFRQPVISENTANIPTGTKTPNSRSTTDNNFPSDTPIVSPTSDRESNTGLYAPEQRWLSDSELEIYYKDMHISSLDTADLGKTFLAVDWNSKPDSRTVSQAESGRMVALGYENYQLDNIERGGRWGALNVIYSTYDFALGTEYHTYAKKDDYNKLRSGEYQPGIVVNNVKGIVNYKIMPFFGNGQLAKNVVFPFENYYVVFTYYIVNQDKGLDNTIRDLNEGNYPQKYKSDLDRFDSLVKSATFKDKQF